MNGDESKDLARCKPDSEILTGLNTVSNQFHICSMDKVGQDFGFSPRETPTIFLHEPGWTLVLMPGIDIKIERL